MNIFNISNHGLLPKCKAHSLETCIGDTSDNPTQATSPMHLYKYKKSIHYICAFFVPKR